ncbi:hypothetical protein C2845_PM07G31470 [Panicum miliaceum]|uniref:Uncharacterized protein n=1 Tax=Panicum miliaceum TaxID=4540 RepID=A0A3L6SJX4_PANMI|nr:hypothetical protein C2845_PM07G31470 [Panicum miliaceum]
MARQLLSPARAREEETGRRHCPRPSRGGRRGPLRRWKPFFASFGLVDAAIEAAGPALCRDELRGEVVELLCGVPAGDGGEAVGALRCHQSAAPRGPPLGRERRAPGDRREEARRRRRCRAPRPGSGRAQAAVVPRGRSRRAPSKSTSPAPVWGRRARERGGEVGERGGGGGAGHAGSARPPWPRACAGLPPAGLAPPAVPSSPAAARHARPPRPPAARAAPARLG